MYVYKSYLFIGDLSKPSFRVLNPYGEVPVLEDGDLKVTNAVPIILYLAEKYTKFNGFGISKSQEMKVFCTIKVSVI